MQILAVRQARFLAFFNVEELNPAGRALVHDFMKEFIARYEFLRYPQKVEDMDEEKGITFENGKWNDYGISRMVMFSWGIVVDTNASTDVSEAVLQDALAWAAERFGLSNRPDLISRKGYVSEIIFRSDLTLPAVNPALQKLSSRITSVISANFHQELNYEISGVALHFDTQEVKQFFAPFKVERHQESPYPDKKFYSGAPLPTDEHIKLLEEFEAILMT